MARVIPGVEVKVVKEIVPQALYPSGVVGMIGTAEGGPVLKPTGVTSYRELVSIFGGESGSLVRDAKLAFLNGVFQVFDQDRGDRRDDGLGDPRRREEEGNGQADIEAPWRGRK